MITKFTKPIVFVLISTLSIMAEVRYGISAKYEGDIGIEDDPAVVFTENFEETSLSNVFSRYSSVKAQDDMHFSTSELSDATYGTRSMQMGGETGSQLFRSFAPGFDTLYVRFYAKWPSATGLQYHHSGIQIQGYNPVSEWPQGFAGNAPDGNDHFATAIECGGTGTRKLYFYTYWKDMKSYNNSSSFYGNRFLGGLDSWNGVDLTVDTTEWVCIELMVKTNTPVTSSNGEQALWVNGELVYHVCDTAKGRWSGGDLWTPFGRTLDTFPGFQWRTTGNLKINMIGLQHYLEVEPKADFMYYDDVVVAKEYIGPIWNGSLAISKNAGISLIQYKNPVLLQNGYLFMNVSSDKSYRLSIYTPSGRTVYKQRFSGNKVFNAGRYFSNGNYIVNIQAEGYKIHKKIVIK